jgi:hypothetical protein
MQQSCPAATIRPAAETEWWEALNGDWRPSPQSTTPRRRAAHERFRPDPLAIVAWAGALVAVILVLAVNRRATS